MNDIRRNYKDKKELIRSYFVREIDAIKRLDIDEINDAINAIWDAYEREATIYICGNGGSAATASHYACDFNKGISENRNKKFNVICLSDNIPTITAIANDFSYDEIFRYPIEGKLKDTDLFICISGSGNSKNIIKAVEYAKDIGCKVIGITGFDGGRLKELADYHMDVNVNDMQITEDLHMVFDHLMFYVMNSWYGENRKDYQDGNQ